MFSLDVGGDGGLDLTSASIATLFDFDPDLGPDTTYYFLAGDGEITIPGVVNNLYRVSSLTIADNVIPEPSTLVIWGLLGALGMTVGWRRRGSK